MASKKKDHDEEIVTLALQQTGMSYQYASDLLKSQKHIQELAL